MGLNLPKFGKNKSNYNKQVLHFFIRLFLLVTAWTFFWTLFLKPARTIDKPLTYLLTASVVHVVNAVSPNTPTISWETDPKRNCAFLVQNGVNVFEIWDACNGIDLMIIYLGIIILLPYPIKRKIFFSVGGVIVIILANILRISLLYLIYIYYRTAFEFSHHYLFSILMYLLIFYGWLLYIKTTKEHETGS